MFSASIAAAAPFAHTRSQRLTYSGRTDRGLQRSQNEDCFRVVPDVGLVVVADGIGGAAAGEVAARMAVDLVCEAYPDSDMTWPSTVQEDGGLPRLVAAVQRANRRIHRTGEQRPAWRGMGTTIAAVLALGSRAAVVHVGDSRVYRLRGRRLEQVTEDHSMQSEPVRRGGAGAGHPEASPPRHVLTRCLGTAPRVEVDRRLLEALPGDTFLVCSDGLWGVVAHREIAAILLERADLDEATARLVDRANELGGPDNVTAALLRVG